MLCCRKRVVMIEHLALGQQRTLPTDSVTQTEPVMTAHCAKRGCECDDRRRMMIAPMDGKRVAHRASGAAIRRRQTCPGETVAPSAWRRATRKRASAANTQSAATQPRSPALPLARVNEPSAAPSEKPRYMKEAFRERTTAASFSPAMPISLACCAGKKPQAARPQTTIATRTGRIAAAGDSRPALVDRLAKASARDSRLTTITGRAPNRSLKVPPTTMPTAAATPQMNSTVPTEDPAISVVDAKYTPR